MRWIRPWISDEVGGVMYYQTMVGCVIEESVRRSSILRILLREKRDPISYGPRPAVPGSSQSRPVGKRLMGRGTMHEIETGAVQPIMTLPGRYLNERKLALTFEQLYCFQRGHFAHDAAFWCSRLLPLCHISPLRKDFS